MRTAKLGIMAKSALFGALAVVLFACSTDPTPAEMLDLTCDSIGSDGRINLERYIAATERDTPLPTTDSPNYFAELPPICFANLPAERSVITAIATLDGEPLATTRASDGNAAFVTLPVRAPSTAMLVVEVVDNTGATARATRELEWYWEETADLVSTELEVLAGVVMNGMTTLNFLANYTPLSLSNAPATTTTTPLRQTYAVEWQFTDSDGEPLDMPVQESLQQGADVALLERTFSVPAEFRVTTTFTGEDYGNAGSSEFDVAVGANGQFTVSDLSLTDVVWHLRAVTMSDPASASESISEFANPNLMVTRTIFSSIATGTNQSHILNTRRTEAAGARLRYEVRNSVELPAAPDSVSAGEQVRLRFTYRGSMELGEAEPDITNPPPIASFSIASSASIAGAQEFSLQPEPESASIINAELRFPIPATPIADFTVSLCLLETLLEARDVCVNWIYATEEGN